MQSGLYKASEPQEMDSLVKATQSVWRIAQGGELTAESEGDLADETQCWADAANLCGTVFETGVGAVSISRQQN